MIDQKKMIRKSKIQKLKTISKQKSLTVDNLQVEGLQIVDERQEGRKIFSMTKKILPSSTISTTHSPLNDLFESVKDQRDFLKIAMTAVIKNLSMPKVRIKRHCSFNL